MQYVNCVKCGGTIDKLFDGARWCVSCVQTVLREQAVPDDVVLPEVIEV